MLATAIIGLVLAFLAFPAKATPLADGTGIENTAGDIENGIGKYAGTEFKDGFRNGSLQHLAPGVVGARIYQRRHRFSSAASKRINARIRDVLRKPVVTTSPDVFTPTGDPSRFSNGAHTLTPTIAEAAYNRLTYYLMNITIGTPAQDFLVQIDTGSSDLWVPSRIIQYNGYDPTQSRTFRQLPQLFDISYVKDHATGYWALDNVGMGGSGVNVQNMQFAVANSAPDATMGILGIGPIESETSQVVYPNLPLRLVQDGFISRNVFSMYMGTLEDESGSILFGGADTAKYRNLVTLPMTSSQTLQVQLDGISVGAPQPLSAPPSAAPPVAPPVVQQPEVASTQSSYIPPWLSSALPSLFADSEANSRNTATAVTSSPLQNNNIGSQNSPNTPQSSSPINEWFWALFNKRDAVSYVDHVVEDHVVIIYEIPPHPDGDGWVENAAVLQPSGLSSVAANSTPSLSIEPSSSIGAAVPSGTGLNSATQLATHGPLQVLLDTGTSLAYLPSDIVKNIATKFGASYEEDLGMYVVNQRDLDAIPIDGAYFSFAGLDIHMPKSEMFWPLSWFTMEESPYYVMTMLPNSQSLEYNILGDSFLRNAYVIYDLDRRQVQLGQYIPTSRSNIISL